MPISTLTLLQDFAGGQGVGLDNYFDYPVDFDSNFTGTENWAAEVTSAINALQGTAATLVLDLLRSLSPSISAGRVGFHSLDARILTGPSRLQVDTGDFLDSSANKINSAGAVFAVPANDDYWVAIDVTGVLTLETAAAQQVADLYTVTVAASVFTDLLPVAEILVDGDDLQALRRPTGDNATSYPASTFDTASKRVEAIELETDTPKYRGKNAAFSVTTGAANPIDFTTDDYKEGITHSTVSAQDVITIDKDGLYLLVAYGKFTAAAGGTVRGLRFTVGGSATDRAEDRSANDGTLPDTRLITEVLELDATNIVRVEGEQDTGGGLNIDVRVQVTRISKKAA